MARKMNCWKPWRFGRPAASADRSSPSVAAPVETGSLERSPARNATSGSTFEGHRAGTKLATAATEIRTTATKQ